MKEKGPTDRRTEGFIVPDDDMLLSHGDIVTIINPDGSSDRELLVDRTNVSGTPGKSGFIKWIIAKIVGTGEEIKIKPGERVKYLRGDDEPEIYL